MLMWIVIGVVVAGIALWAFWPRRRGVLDGDVDRLRRTTAGRIDGKIGPHVDVNGPSGGAGF